MERKNEFIFNIGSKYRRPSSTNDEITEHSDYEYYRAEKMGKEGVPCERVFKECKASILNQFSGIYTPVMNLLGRIL